MEEGSENDLVNKVLGQDLSSKNFEKLFKAFREKLSTLAKIEFYDTYQWFSDGNTITFAATPEEEEKMKAYAQVIEPNFSVSKDALILKFGIYSADYSYFFEDKNYFFTAELSWPFKKWEMNFNVTKKSKLAKQIKQAAKHALEQYEP